MLETFFLYIYSLKLAMKKIKTLIVPVLFLLISSVVVSQNIATPPMPAAPGGAASTPPPGLPIDGGLVILIALGMVYGVYKLIMKQKTLNV